jgi:hypothetical protein
MKDLEVLSIQNFCVATFGSWSMEAPIGSSEREALERYNYYRVTTSGGSMAGGSH